MIFDPKFLVVLQNLDICWNEMYFPVDFMAAYKWVFPPLLCCLTGKQNYGKHARNFQVFLHWELRAM